MHPERSRSSILSRYQTVQFFTVFIKQNKKKTVLLCKITILTKWVQFYLIRRTYISFILLS